MALLNLEPLDVHYDGTSFNKVYLQLQFHKPTPKRCVLVKR